MPWKATALSDLFLEAAFGGTAFQIAAPHLSLHDGHPGNTGASEVSGGTYARQPLVAKMGTATGGAIANDGEIQFTLLPAVPTPGILFAGLWSALTVGTFYGFMPIESVYIYAIGANTGDVFTSYAHGLANDDRVYLRKSIGQGMPAGPVADTLYWVVGVTTDTFQISATQGGGAVALTSDGEAVVTKVVGKVTNLNDSFTIAIGDLDIIEEG